MEETAEEVVVTVGQRLREAREAKGISIEDIAASTRIPTRHLLAMENGDWDKLPAPTYTIGFAKNYAAAVGLDRAAIGDALREEMGGSRPIYSPVEVFEAADPARTMPKGLVIGSLVLLALVVAGLMWLRGRSLQPDPVAEPPAANAPVNSNAAPSAAPPTATAAPVSIVANDRVWVDIRDGQAILKQGEMAAGERFDVPPGAVAPTITTGKPEALQILVGQQTAPTIGPAGQRASGVSLKGADLLKPAASAAVVPPPAPAQNAAPARPRPVATRPATSPGRTTGSSPATPPAPEPAAAAVNNQPAATTE